MCDDNHHQSLCTVTAAYGAICREKGVSIKQTNQCGKAYYNTLLLNLNFEFEFEFVASHGSIYIQYFFTI